MIKADRHHREDDERRAADRHARRERYEPKLQGGGGLVDEIEGDREQKHLGQAQRKRRQRHEVTENPQHFIIPARESKAAHSYRKKVAEVRTAENLTKLTYGRFGGQALM